MSILRVELLRGLQIQLSSQQEPVRLARLPSQLISLLCLFHGESLSFSWVAECLWNNMPERSAHRRLSTTLWRVKSQVPQLAPYLKQTRDYLRLEFTQSSQLDLLELAELSQLSKQVTVEHKNDELFARLDHLVDVGVPNLSVLIDHPQISTRQEHIKSQFITLLQWLHRYAAHHLDRIEQLKFQRRLVACEPAMKDSYTLPKSTVAAIADTPQNTDCQSQIYQQIQSLSSSLNQVHDLLHKLSAENYNSQLSKLADSLVRIEEEQKQLKSMINNNTAKLSATLSS